MLSIRRLTSLLLSGLAALVVSGWVLGGALQARAVRNGAVQVELVARQAAVQPGQPFWVALRVEHDAPWHTYWLNAGTGYPTSLAWTLPEGFSAGPIVWPAPHTVKDTAGNVTGNGYEGTVHLFVQITPPATLAVGSTVQLRAAADWLMCAESCMPGDAKVALTLPVAADPGAENAAVAKAFADLPRDPAPWGVSARRDGAKVFLTITAPQGAAAAHVPEGLHFFEEQALIDYAAPQTVTAGKGTWSLELATVPDAPADAAHLKGLLVAKNGWTAGEGYAALAVDVPFAAAKAAGASAPAGATVSGAAGTSSLASANAGSAAASGSGAAVGAGATDGAAASAGLLGTVLLAFLGGVVLNLMPCVFPVLGIKVLGFVNQAGSDRGKIVLHGLVFTAGVLASFWALAGALLALRAGGEQLGWGFQLQSAAFVYGMAIFMFVFALNLSGLFEVGLSATGAAAGLQSQEGLGGSFFTGMLATLVATPCSAPFLAPALGAALALSAVESLVVFTAIAVGLSAPYLLLSLFPSAVKVLPRPGAWMETFKQLMAFPLYATVGWLVWVLAAQTAGDDYGLLMILFAFVLVAMAAWAYGRFGQAHGKPSRQRWGTAAALALLVAGVALGWPQPPPAVGSSSTGAGGASGKGAYAVAWQPWSPEAVAAAQAAGRTIYVDFTARWCATCQTNKAAVFSSSEVLAELARRDVLLLKADWTNKDPRITQELAKFQRSAVPFNLLYHPGQAAPRVLPELLTPGIVLDALRSAGAP
jgi:thiol:disulfide interchange protein DsbD